MFFRKIILAALVTALPYSFAHGLVLTGSTFFVDQVEDEKHELDFEDEYESIGSQSETNLQDYLELIQPYLVDELLGDENGADIYAPIIAALEDVGSWAFEGDEQQYDAQPGYHFSFEQISDYHASLDFWWMDWVCESIQGHSIDSETKDRAKALVQHRLDEKLVVWQNFFDGFEGPKEVPTPTAFILFSSALGLIVGRKKFS